MTHKNEDFCKQMRKATRDIHAISDALVNAKLAFGLSNNMVWADGLLIFYDIFRYLEEAMDRLKDSKIGLLRIEGLQRTKAFEEDLEFYLGKDWKKKHNLRNEVTNYLLHLKEIEEKQPLLLMAYTYHLYMGLLSGGMILRKKRQLVKKLNPFHKESKKGNMVTDFGHFGIYQLKMQMRNTMNEVAKTLDADIKNKLLEESKTVFILNNQIIKTVKGAGLVAFQKCIVIIIIIFVIILIYLLKYK